MLFRFIDAAILLHRACAAHPDDWSWVYYIAAKVEWLRDMKIKPIFVFDGVHPIEKMPIKEGGTVLDGTAEKPEVNAKLDPDFKARYETNEIRKMMLRKHEDLNETYERRMRAANSAKDNYAKLKEEDELNEAARRAELEQESTITQDTEDSVTLDSDFQPKQEDPDPFDPKSYKEATKGREEEEKKTAREWRKRRGAYELCKTSR